MYLNWGPPARSLVPRDVQEASRADFGAISDPSGRHWKPKHTVKYRVFAVFSLRHKQRPDRLNQLLGGLRRTPKRCPGAARDAPGGPQDGSKSVTSVPRAPSGPPKHVLAAKLNPDGAKEPSGGAILDPPRAGFAPSGGRFSDSFLFSESIAKAVQWAKLAQAYAQHRFTSCVTSTC